MASNATGRWSRIGARLRALVNESGSATVEYVLLVPVFAILTVGAVDAGSFYYYQMAVGEQVQQGIDYATKSGYNQAQIVSTAENGNSAYTATASQYCGCVNNSTQGVANVSTNTPCSGNCSDGTAEGTYVSVSVSIAYAPIINYKVALSLPSTITSTSTVRIN